jgi:hypothetical protein
MESFRRNLSEKKIRKNGIFQNLAERFLSERFFLKESILKDSDFAENIF